MFRDPSQVFCPADPPAVAGPGGAGGAAEDGVSPLRLAGLRPADLEACLGLDRLALGQLWTEGQWRRELEEERRPAMGLWQGQTLQAMACGWLVVDELHITLVAVHPQRRRQGLGRRVLQALLDRAGNEGAERATLEVAAGNAAALALYGGCGFRSAGVRRGYYRNGEDALIQWKSLASERI